MTGIEFREWVELTCSTCGVPELARKIVLRWNSRFTARMGDAKWFAAKDRGGEKQPTDALQLAVLDGLVAQFRQLGQQLFLDAGAVLAGQHIDGDTEPAGVAAGVVLGTRRGGQARFHQAEVEPAALARAEQGLEDGQGGLIRKSETSTFPRRGLFRFTPASRTSC